MEQKNGQLQDQDNIAINPTLQPWLSEVAASRRQLLKGGLGLALSGFFGGSLSSCAGSGGALTRALKNAPAHIGFRSVGVQLASDFDRVIVAEGYSARAFFSWGDKVVAGAVPWRADASNSGQEQQLQAGQNHDGMAYFPFNPGAADENDHGLLVINHEYTNASLHPNGPTQTLLADGRIQRPRAEVLKEQAAHGVSVIEIKKDIQGGWQRVEGASVNRRLTASTPMQLTGPAAGADALKTQQDPTGTKVLGTLNNCSMGRTPWGTYLVCEENWNNYFVNRNLKDWQARPFHARYGLSNSVNSHYYQWESVDPRFDATLNANAAHGGYVNEPNRFGWVVEFNPFDPNFVPKKRTALGRYARECATVSLAEDGRMAIYSGDDTRGEYIYKFVPKGRHQKGVTTADNDLLDEGTLYVAVFHADGSGDWLPLVWGQGALIAENGFSSQADVVINARGAADLLGATPMDRPEWVAVEPGTHDVYVTLTNNNERGTRVNQLLDAANPRANNQHGQILRWQEQGASPAATHFNWEIFLLAGKKAGVGVPANEVGSIRGDLFSCPDGLWFDPQGRLWIETDYDDNQPAYEGIGCNQLLCANPATRDVRRFLVGPRGCEITGLTGTPDGKSLWLNVQHPGISYPASDGKTRPRSTTVLVTKNDGGVIGS